MTSVSAHANIVEALDCEATVILCIQIEELLPPHEDIGVCVQATAPAWVSRRHSSAETDRLMALPGLDGESDGGGGPE